LGEEVPDAAEQDNRTGDGEDAGTDRGEAQFGNTQPARGAEYFERNVASYGAGSSRTKKMARRARRNCMLRGKGTA
jgi:hypothetical protein